MGTRMAPSYANLFMASLEKQILNTAPSQLKPLIWKRYIDDIFMIWSHGESSLQNVLHHLNSFHPTIKFQHWNSTNPSNSLTQLSTSPHNDPSKPPSTSNQPTRASYCTPLPITHPRARWEQYTARPSNTDISPWTTTNFCNTKTTPTQNTVGTRVPTLNNPRNLQQNHPLHTKKNS